MNITLHPVLDNILAWIDPISLYQYRIALTCKAFCQIMASEHFLKLQYKRWPELAPEAPSSQSTRLMVLRFSAPDLFPIRGDLSRLISPRFSDGIWSNWTFPSSKGFASHCHPDDMHSGNISEQWLYARALESLRDSDNNTEHGSVFKLESGVVIVVGAHIDWGSAAHDMEERYHPIFLKALKILQQIQTIQIPHITDKLPCAKPHCYMACITDNPIPFRTALVNNRVVELIKGISEDEHTLAISMMRMIYRRQPDGSYLGQNIPFTVAEFELEMDIISRVAVSPA